MVGKNYLSHFRNSGQFLHISASQPPPGRKSSVGRAPGIGARSDPEAKPRLEGEASRRRPTDRRRRVEKFSPELFGRAENRTELQPELAAAVRRLGQLVKRA